MSTLSVISVNDEGTAKDAVERVLHLHAVVLLTLEGCSLLHRENNGEIETMATPEPGFGSAQFVEDPAFRALVSVLGTVSELTTGSIVAGTAGNTEGTGDLFDRSTRESIARALAPGRWSVVFLAHSVALAEVALQLESLGGERFSVPVSDSDKDTVLSSFA